MAISLQGQQIPLVSQYMNNSFYVNPAIAGSTNHNSVRLLSRRQWGAIKQGPLTNILSVHGRLGQTSFYDNRGFVYEKSKFSNDKALISRDKKPLRSGNEAMGAILYSDRSGPITRMGVVLAYAYHFRLDGMRNRFNEAAQFSIGASTDLMQFTVDESQFILYHENDPILSMGKESAFVPDFGIGAYIYNKNYYAGYSAQHLLQSKISLNRADPKANRMIRHHYLLGGYKYSMNSDWEIEPSLLFKTTEITPYQFDISCKFNFREHMSTGMSVRNNGDLALLFGWKWGRWVLAYSYDYSFSRITYYGQGSHEFVLGVNVSESIYGGISRFGR
jgi:type IX secretion system PorP/SprF family membrane protein